MDGHRRRQTEQPLGVERAAGGTDPAGCHFDRIGRRPRLGRRQRLDDTAANAGATTYANTHSLKNARTAAEEAAKEQDTKIKIVKFSVNDNGFVTVTVQMPKSQSMSISQLFTRVSV